MAASAVTGQAKEIRLGQGMIRYREVGGGPAVLFVHGILENGALWRGVVPRLSEHFRCVVPDLPLGGHAVPLNQDADLTTRGVARTVADLLEALELGDVTLVGNDTGGAICHIGVAEHPERVRSLVLTNCDAYETFFPTLLSPFHYAARFFGMRLVDLLFFPLRLAGRLQRDFPDARLELVDRSRTFVPEDRPERLAELIAGFLRGRANAGAGGGFA